MVVDDEIGRCREIVGKLKCIGAGAIRIYNVGAPELKALGDRSVHTCGADPGNITVAIKSQNADIGERPKNRGV